MRQKYIKQGLNFASYRVIVHGIDSIGSDYIGSVFYRIPLNLI